ncbi:hypothetical protein GCM10029992_37790 [Glycomyces albus]
MYFLSGQIGISIAYIAIAAILGLFAFGYLAMARHITNAGAMYAFVSHGIGRIPGVGVAWIAATSYSALQIGLYGLLGWQASALAYQLLGLHVPWWAAALTAWALIALLGTHAVDINAGVLAVLLAAEIVIVAVFSASNLLHPAGGAVSFAALDPTQLTGSAAGGVLVLALLAFVGFESPTVFAEEARDRRRTVARATYATIGILAVLYVGASWSMPVAAGDEAIISAAAADENIWFTLAGEQLGSGWSTTGQVLLLTSVAAAALSFHNTVARYLFALGREYVLPAGLGRTSARHCAPAAASLTQSAVAGAVILTFAASGLDPLVHLFFFVGNSSGLGLTTMFTCCAVAVVVYFWRNRRGERIWTAYIAPAFALVALVIVMYLSFRHFHTLLGVPQEALVPRLVPILVAALGLLGAGWGLCLKLTRPTVFGGIGRGAKASLAQTGTAPTPAAGAGWPVTADACSNDRAAALLARAFQDVPPARWLVADPVERRRAVQGQFAILVDHAHRHGDVATAGSAEDPVGAVVWFDHVGGVPPEPDEFEARLRQACGPHTDRFLTLGQAMAARHPIEPHVYVALVGVRPDQWGQGIATGLLQRLHQHLDEAGTPAYLEAVSERTAGLYGRLGYRPHGEPFAVDDHHGPLLYPMWRPPAIADPGPAAT